MTKKDADGVYSRRIDFFGHEHHPFSMTAITPLTDKLKPIATPRMSKAPGNMNANAGRDGNVRATVAGAVVEIVSVAIAGAALRRRAHKGLTTRAAHQIRFRLLSRFTVDGLACNV